LNSSRTLMAVERALIAHLDDPWAAESIPMRALDQVRSSAQMIPAAYETQLREGSRRLEEGLVRMIFHEPAIPATRPQLAEPAGCAATT
jgi:hypothetical protein